AGDDRSQRGELLRVRRGCATILGFAPLTRPKVDTIEKGDVSRKIEVLRHARVVCSRRHGGERLCFGASDDAEWRIAGGLADANHGLSRGIHGEDYFCGSATATMLIKAP
ncbi:MAG: hypothetical protein ACLP1X_20720, partial [Polyangiaceae bacterium]